MIAKIQTSIFAFVVSVEKDCSDFTLIRKLYRPYVAIAMHFYFTVSL